MRLKKVIKRGVSRFKYLVLSGLVILVLSMYLMPQNVFAITITATATGSLRPLTATYPATVTNGDFLIEANNSTVPLVGDGINEKTTWTFDFTTDPNFSTFSTADPLSSALLTLTLTPKNSLITTDITLIQGLPAINTSVIQGLPVGVTSTVSLELLDYYGSGDILGIFSAVTSGQIPMLYHDDAIVSYAQLDLTPVPEPSTLLLLASGLAGVRLVRRRFKG